jgi:hypothetical protein
METIALLDESFPLIYILIHIGRRRIFNGSTDKFFECFDKIEFQLYRVILSQISMFDINETGLTGLLYIEYIVFENSFILVF